MTVKTEKIPKILSTFDSFTCNGIDKYSPNVCNSRGVCLSENLCSCNASFYGKDCEYQVGWIWLGRNPEMNQNGTYGPIGEFSEEYNPGSRSAFAIGQSSGIIFGGKGFGYDSSTGRINLGDVWKYDSTKAAWSCLSGPNSTATPNYGIKGVPSLTNHPGGRDFASGCSINGNFYIFGGYPITGDLNTYANDLWRFNQTSKEWTWLSGNDTYNVPGVYGTQGEFHPSNSPGSRTESAMVCTESAIFLYGGRGFDDTSAKALGDLWKFDLDSNQWAWIHGKSGAPVRGNKGEPSPDNFPGGRLKHSLVIAQNGELYLFGGTALSSNQNFNDLWVFNQSTWTWLAGSTSYRVDPELPNLIGSREGSAMWITKSGMIYIYGGLGRAKGSTIVLSDLWSFDTNQPDRKSVV